MARDVSGNDDRLAPPALRQVVVVETLALDAFLQQGNALDERFGSGRTAGRVDVDGGGSVALATTPSGGDSGGCADLMVVRSLRSRARRSRASASHRR
jgi:hypothetical protein